MVETRASRFIDKPINSINWRFVAPLIFDEVMQLTGQRLLRRKGGEPISTTRNHITTLLAAELFSDENPPRFVIAESEDEIHEDLRGKFPSESPRLSGEIIEIKNQQSRFFTIDAIMMGTAERLPTETQLEEVVEYLLSQNIIPLDAEMNLVLIGNK